MNIIKNHPANPIADQLSEWLTSLQLEQIPESAYRITIRDIHDACGLAVSSAHQSYCAPVAANWDANGPCTVLGLSGSFDVSGAALLNGMAIHGEDFDDTLEGAPIRVGAMTIPAAFAVAERYSLSGQRALLGVVAGL